MAKKSTESQKNRLLWGAIVPRIHDFSDLGRTTKKEVEPALEMKCKEAKFTETKMFLYSHTLFQFWVALFKFSDFAWFMRRKSAMCRQDYGRTYSQFFLLVFDAYLLKLVGIEAQSSTIYKNQK